MKGCRPRDKGMAKITFSCGPVSLLAMSGGTDSHTQAVDFQLWLLATGPGSAVQLAGSHCRRFLQGTQGAGTWVGLAPAVLQHQRVYSQSPSWLPTSSIFFFFSFPLEKCSCFFVWWIKRRGSGCPDLTTASQRQSQGPAVRVFWEKEGGRWIGGVMSRPCGLCWQSSFLLSVLLLRLPWTQALS